MPYITIYDCPDCGKTEQTTNPFHCSSHIDILTETQRNIIKQTEQNRIDKKVRLSMSLYQSNRATRTIVGDTQYIPLDKFNGVNQSQASDRNQFHTQKPTYKKFRPKIGLGAGGEGVDVKHGSFARIMARKKANNCCS